MREKYAKFMQILRVELEDLEEDINTLAEMTEERRRQHQITEYVNLENISLLKQEFAGIRDVVENLKRIDMIENESFPDFVERLKTRIREVIVSSSYPDAIYIFIDRRIQKVVEYISGNIV